ncbi:MAG: DUF615 domain-containing protein [Gammaproteobacteria bacterium]|nr:DUF615 domain-containing protein [Gammaproteobacteria bacterium]
MFDEIIDENSEFLSKSQIKRDLHEIQKLGVKLLALPLSTLENHTSDAILLQAFETAKNISSHIAKKRQLKYIGKLLAKIAEDELNELKTLVDVKEGQLLQSNQHFHQLEKWRDKLLQHQDQAISELLQEHPHLDRQQLRQLVRNAQKEQKLNKSPKSARLIFQLLKKEIPL